VRPHEFEMCSVAGTVLFGGRHRMNATAELTREQSSPPAVGLGRIVNNSVALILLDLLNKAIPLVVFPRVVRALGPAAYGRLGFAAAVAGFFGLLASPGFSTYALREAAKNSQQVSFLVKHVLGARVVFAIGAYALLAIFTLFLAPSDGQTRLLIMLSGLAFVAGSLDTQWIFAARSRMSMIAVQGALAQLAYAGLILALVRGSRDAWIVPSATVLSLGLSTLLIWVPARRQYHIPLPEISPQAWGVFLPICLVMGFSSLMSMI
jgi:O-antigen/teichoic acid export membrane protein